MPDKRTTRAETTSIKRDHTEEMPQDEAAPRTEQQQPIGEQKVLETVEGIMEKLSLFMNQTNQSFQEMRKQNNQSFQELRKQMEHSEAVQTPTNGKFRGCSKPTPKVSHN